jgi:hypothetical protein
MWIAWAVIALVLFIFGLAAIEVWGDGVDGEVVPGWFILCALWPLTLSILAVVGVCYGSFKGAVWLLQVVKEAYEQYSSQREG